MNRREASRCLQILPWPMHRSPQRNRLFVLYERDPSLARSISSSREAIWQILADRERFRLMH